MTVIDIINNYSVLLKIQDKWSWANMKIEANDRWRLMTQKKHWKPMWNDVNTKWWQPVKNDWKPLLCDYWREEEAQQAAQWEESPLCNGNQPVYNVQVQDRTYWRRTTMSRWGEGEDPMTMKWRESQKTCNNDNGLLLWYWRPLLVWKDQWLKTMTIIDEEG